MIYKRGQLYWMDSMINGVRYRLPLKTKNWQEALRREKEEEAAIANGKSGHHRVTARQTFDTAIAGYVDNRKLHSAEKTYVTDTQRSRPLLNFFGGIRIKRITSEMIEEYQHERSKSGVSGANYQHGGRIASTDT